MRQLRSWDLPLDGDRFPSKKTIKMSDVAHESEILQIGIVCYLAWNYCQENKQTRWGKREYISNEIEKQFVPNP